MAKLRLQKADKGHANSERWLLTYADLITLLLAFFVVMYSMSKVETQRFVDLAGSMQRAFNIPVLKGSDEAVSVGEQGATRISTDFERISSEMAALTKQMGIAQNVEVTMSREGIIIRVSGNLLFDSGRADLKDDALPVLAAITKRVRSMPNELRVEGHTDDIPINTPFYPSNWELSSARALAVTRYLVDNGISPRRLGSIGFGEYRPVVPNDTRDNRAKNRRVDIVIAYPDEAKASGG